MIRIGTTHFPTMFRSMAKNVAATIRSVDALVMRTWVPRSMNFVNPMRVSTQRTAYAASMPLKNSSWENSCPK